MKNLKLNQSNELLAKFDEYFNLLPHLEQRDIKLKAILKEIRLLPINTQTKLKYHLNKILERHQTIRRSNKIINYYLNNHQISFDLKPKS